MSQYARLQSLHSMREEVETERRKMLDEIARLDQEAAILDELVRNYVQLTGATVETQVVASEGRMTDVPPRTSPPTTNTIRTEILHLMRDVGKPLHYRLELLPLLLQRGVQFSSDNPSGSLSAHLSEDSRFVKVPGRPGYWGLASWRLRSGDPPPSEPLKPPDEIENEQASDSSVREERTEGPLKPAQNTLLGRTEMRPQWVEIPNPPLPKRHVHEPGMMA